MGERDGWDVGSFNEVVVMDVLKALRSMVRRFQETVGMAMCMESSIRWQQQRYLWT